jgi:hypothetical protein
MVSINVGIDVDYYALRRDPSPSPELLASFDPRIFVKTIDDVLARTEKPLHRAILENYRRHGILEMLGRWYDILIPDMMVDHPVYNISIDGQTFHCDGLEQVQAMYSKFAAEANVVFGPLYERIAVADWGLAMETFLYMPNTGVFLNQMGYDLDVDKSYAVTRWVSQVWPYDENGKLMGEMIFEDPGSVRVTEIDPASVMGVEQGALLIEPLLDSPVPEFGA